MLVKQPKICWLARKKTNNGYFLDHEEIRLGVTSVDRNADEIRQRERYARVVFFSAQVTVKQIAKLNDWIIRG